MGALAGCGGGGLSDHEQLFVVHADGSHRRQITHGAAAHVSPSWSPDGRRIAFAATRCGSVSLEVADRDGGPVSTLARRHTCVGDLGIGWARRGGAIALLTRFEAPAVVTVDVIAPDGSRPRRVASFRTSMVAPIGPVWSPRGTELAYAGKSNGGSFDVIAVARNGRSRPLTSGPEDDFDPRWSPRGDSILLVRVIGRGVLGLITVPARGGRARPLPGRWVDVRAEWAPDGESVALTGVPADRDGRYRVYRLDVTSGSLRELARDPAAVRPAWSPDGSRIAFATDDGRVATVGPNGGPIETLVDLGDAEIRDLIWSPDGARLAFVARKPPPED